MVGIMSSVVLERGGRPLHITWLKKLAGLLSEPRRDELARLLGVTRVVDWSGLRVPLLRLSDGWLSHHEVVENGPGRQRSVLGQEAPVLRSRVLGLRCWWNPLPRKPQAEVLVEILIFHC